MDVNIAQCAVQSPRSGLAGGRGCEEGIESARAIAGGEIGGSVDLWLYQLLPALGGRCPRQDSLCQNMLRSSEGQWEIISPHGRGSGALGAVACSSG